MALRIVFTRRALKDLRSLPKEDRERAMDRISAFAGEPTSPQHDVIHLVGQSKGYRLRVGDWRVVFNVDNEVIEVLRIGHRREVYR